MKRNIIAILLATTLLSACAPIPPSQTTPTLSLGDTFSCDGVSFTLNDFCFAEKIDFDTYDPNMIDGSSWGPNDGYIWGYVNYTIENNSTETLSHFMDLDVVLEYGEGFTYGKDMTDYEVSCTETDKYNLDVDPLMSKTYHHAISNCPESISTPTEDIKIVVEINNNKCIFAIPSGSVTVNPGKDAPKPEIPFVEADSATDKKVRKLLNEAEYEWYNGTTKCTLAFTKTKVTLTQRISGQNFTVSGTYVVGTDKLKVNYGYEDVFYGWSNTGGDYLDITIIDQ